jgi:multiple sugar transport system substrate-binding protein
MHEGKLYGIPHRNDVRVWHYRRSILEEAGVTAVPTTWDEQLDAATKITKREGDQLIHAGYPPVPAGGAGGNQWFMNLLYQAGGDMVTPDNTKAAFNSAEGLLAMEFSLEVLDFVYPDHNFMLPEAAVPDFVSGRVPVGYGIGPIRQMAENAPDEMSDIWFAGAVKGRGPKAVQAAWTGVGAKFISRDSENPDQGWKLIEFLNSAEYGTKWLEALNTFPTSTAVIKAGVWSEEPLWLELAEAADKFGRPMVFMPEPGKMHEAMGRETARVMHHEVTPEEGLAAAEKEWNEVLAKYYG